MKTLIDAADLRELLRGNEAPLLLDCSFDLADTEAGERAWRLGHLPGAQYVHLDRDLAGDKHDAAGRFLGRHPLPERGALAQAARPARGHAGNPRGLLRRAGWRRTRRARGGCCAGWATPTRPCSMAAWPPGARPAATLSRDIPPPRDAPPYPAQPPAMPTIDAARLQAAPGPHALDRRSCG